MIRNEAWLIEFRQRLSSLGFKFESQAQDSLQQPIFILQIQVGVCWNLIEKIIDEEVCFNKFFVIDVKPVIFW